MDLFPVNQAFANLDKNNDGVLTREEFAALAGMQPPPPPTQSYGAPNGGPPVPRPGMPMQPGQALGPGIGTMGSQRPCGMPPGTCPQPRYGSAQVSSQPSYGEPPSSPMMLGQPPCSQMPPGHSLVPLQMPIGGGSPYQPDARQLRGPSPLPCGGPSMQSPLLPCLALRSENSSPVSPERTFNQLGSDLSGARSELPEASFEHKIDLLDKRETELQNLNLKIVAEQAQSFSRDVESLRRSMQDMQRDMGAIQESLGISHSKLDEHAQSLSMSHRFMAELRGPHATADERIKYLETAFGDSLGKHENLLNGLRDAHEGTRREINDVKAATQHHASFEQRMNFMEKTVGDSFEKHAQALNALQDSHQTQFKELDGVKAHTTHHASYGQRIDYLEKCLGDTADRHKRELKSMKEAHESHVQGLTSVFHASLPERMAYVEKMMGDSADKHAKEFASLRASQDRHAGDVTGLQASASQHAGVVERIGYLEKVLGDNADRHMKEIQGLKEAHGRHATQLSGVQANQNTNVRMEDRIAYVEQIVGDSAGKHIQDIEAMKAHYNGHLARFDQQHGTHVSMHSGLKERVDQMEHRLGITTDSHINEVNGLKDAHARQASGHGQLCQDLEAMKLGHHQSTAQLMDTLRRMQELEQGHALTKSQVAQFSNNGPMAARLQQLEAVLGDSFDKQGKELSSLKDAHGLHSKMLEGHNLTTSQRLDAIERALSFATDEKLKQTEEALRSTATMYEQIRGRPSR